jgi:hypothetical protein
VSSAPRLSARAPPPVKRLLKKCFTFSVKVGSSLDWLGGVVAVAGTAVVGPEASRRTVCAAPSLGSSVPAATGAVAGGITSEALSVRYVYQSFS